MSSKFPHNKNLNLYTINITVIFVYLHSSNRSLLSINLVHNRITITFYILRGSCFNLPGNGEALTERDDTRSNRKRIFFDACIIKNCNYDSSDVIRKEMS